MENNTQALKDELKALKLRIKEAERAQKIAKKLQEEAKKRPFQPNPVSRICLNALKVISSPALSIWGFADARLEDPVEYQYQRLFHRYIKLSNKAKKVKQKTPGLARSSAKLLLDFESYFSTLKHAGYPIPDDTEHEDIIGHLKGLIEKHRTSENLAQELLTSFELQETEKPKTKRKKKPSCTDPQPDPA